MDVDSLLRSNIVTRKGILYISSTSYLEYLSCPMRTYFSKIKKLRLMGPLAAAFVYGSAVHKAMESYWRTWETPKFFPIWDLYAANKDLYYNDQEQDYVTLLEKGQTSVERIVETLKRINAEPPYVISQGKRQGRMAIEVQDRVKLTPNIVLVRTFDAIVPVEGIPTVIDFKTAYRMYSVGLQEVTSDQLTAYLLPHSIPGVPQPRRAAFIVASKTKSPEADFFPTTRSVIRLREFRDDVIRVARLIDDGVFYRCRGEMTCGSLNSPRCDYYALCYELEGANSLYTKGDWK